MTQDIRASQSGLKIGLPTLKRAAAKRKILLLLEGIRCFLDKHKRMRDWALFDLAIDSKLRGCDLVKIRIDDLVSGYTVRH